MSLIAACRCGARFQAPPHLAGKQVACPTCGQALVVPAPAQASSPIPVACRCGQRFAAPPNLAGKQVACPKCRSPIQVPHPGGSYAPAATNHDGFWDDIGPKVKTPQEIYEAETAKPEPLAPNKATSYAIDRLARGAAPAVVFSELRAKGVGPEEAERIVEDLQEGKKRSIKGGAQHSHNSKVGMAFWGLSVPGGLSLLGGIVLVVLIFMRENLESTQLALLIGLTAYMFVMGIGSIATSVMLQNKFKPARYFGFFFAILYLCGSPLHLICGVCALISLSSGDMTEYLNEK